MTVIIVDYGIGNVASILNMLKKIGVPAAISSSREDIEAAEKLVLPGIGAFDHGMESLESRGLVNVLRECVLERRVPILGICLGMQLFALRSAEGARPGLGWIQGAITRFETPPEVKVPHMGWNDVRIVRDGGLLHGFGNENPRFYFVHSFHWSPHHWNPDHWSPESELPISGTSFHGYDFPAIISHENVHGVQFHPEKSHRFGMKLLKNFVELC